MKQKTCNKCDVELDPLSNWLKCSINKSHYICSKCKKTEQKKYREVNKDKIKTYARKWNYNNKDKKHIYYQEYKKKQRTLEFLYYHTNPDYKKNRLLSSSKYHKTIKGQIALKKAKNNFKKNKFGKLYYGIIQKYGVCVPMEILKKDYEQIKKIYEE